jgi:hypothetical protein
MGDVTLKFTGEFNTFVSWGSLERLGNKLSSVDEHARHGIESIRKRA